MKGDMDKEFKEIIRKLVIQCFAIALCIVLGVLVMIKGWGLEPVSWWWIIGVGVFGRIAAEMLVMLGK